MRGGNICLATDRTWGGAVIGVMGRPAASQALTIVLYTLAAGFPSLLLT